MAFEDLATETINNCKSGKLQPKLFSKSKLTQLLKVHITKQHWCVLEWYIEHRKLEDVLISSSHLT